MVMHGTASDSDIIVIPLNNTTHVYILNELTYITYLTK